MQKQTWEITARGNHCLLIDEEAECFISYCPANPERGEPETALVIGDRYFILLGDWRNDYEKIAHLGKDKCLEFYLQNKEFCHPMEKEDDIQPDDIIYRLQSIRSVLMNIKTLIDKDPNKK